MRREVGATIRSMVTEKAHATTPVREPFRHPGPAGGDYATGGPVIACVDHGPGVRRPGAFLPAFATLRLRSGPAVLCVTGALDATSARELERQGARLIAETGGRLVIDLSDATSIDRDTAHISERLTREAAGLGGRLALVATKQAVRGELAAHPWLVVTDALDVALEAVGERSGAHPAGV